MAQSVFELVGRILIDHDDADTAIDNTTQKAKDLGTALEGTGKSADTASSSLGEKGSFNAAAVWMGNTLYKLTEKAVELGLNIGKLGFNYDADMESYKIAFTTMMKGNSESAEQLIDQLRDLGAVTPMNTAGLVKNAKTMMGFGIAADEVIDTLKMLGDAAQGNQSSLDSLVLAYSQMMAAGQLYAQDAYQMTNAGFPIWQMLSEYTNEEISVLRKMGEKGEITTDMVKNAFKMATAEGGLFYQAMQNQSETFNGKMSTLQDNAEMVAGGLMQSFFDVAKSDVLPKLTESLEAFGIWATENQELLKDMAEAAGNFATMSFDAVLDCVKWLTENGEATATAIAAIGTAMGIAAITAHPYAAAVTAVASALIYLNSEAGKKRGTYDHMFDGYTQEDIDTLNRYVDAMNAVRAAEDAALNDATGSSWGKYDEAVAAEKAALEELLAIENLYETYNTWHSAQAGYAGANGPALNVELQIDDGAESAMQGEIDSMTLEGTVKLYPDTSSLYTSYSYAPGINGSHANGLDYVPHDGYIARLHQGESVLTKQEASVWRSGTGGFDVDALASRFASSVMAALSGKPVVLESGAVVGQLLPAIDTGLGTASTRKGRRN